MRTTASWVVAALFVATACTERDPHNSTFCGLMMMESATRVMNRMPQVHTLLSTAPAELVGDTVPTRVIGYQTGRAIGTPGEYGPVLAYAGEGFPIEPGFGVVLVDDSTEVLHGVLVFDRPPGRGFTQIGTLTNGTRTIPLYGMRIHWESVNSEKCPLFYQPPDSTAS